VPIVEESAPYPARRAKAPANSADLQPFSAVELFRIDSLGTPSSAFLDFPEQVEVTQHTFDSNIPSCAKSVPRIDQLEISLYF
jgi:hypothetical protein